MSTSENSLPAHLSSSMLHAATCTRTTLTFDIRAWPESPAPMAVTPSLQAIHPGHCNGILWKTVTWVGTGQRLLFTQWVPAILRVVSVTVQDPETLLWTPLQLARAHPDASLCFWFFCWGFAGPLLSLPPPPCFPSLCSHNTSVSFECFGNSRALNLYFQSQLLLSRFWG